MNSIPQEQMQVETKITDFLKEYGVGNLLYSVGARKTTGFYSGTLVKTKIDKFLNVSGSRHCSIEQQCREVALCWRDVPDG